VGKRFSVDTAPAGRAIQTKSANREFFKAELSMRKAVGNRANNGVFMQKELTVVYRYGGQAYLIKGY
jgi:hypothetical protein